ncbi:2-amino-4-hydroxy-6-hydroxymethyldihydropteridine diphosphokinase [Corynebacterium ulceribovis]|uniref:2-amino-4-hydroxy-6- hydroxymethyldihydropteridine diphosphokinase n=1 Tax=Corynebacterium ulceribovis TaxID=487732 RepID=UPI000378C238|nr:2-amino-4-hydroxy-6-hydroxymethyldihydropteridine diphosphokinase [Corynebacterium ulceribovis]
MSELPLSDIPLPDQPCTRAVLSIGSNIGDRLNHLQSVRDAFDTLPGARVLAASDIYCSAPWGGVEQQDFLNALLLVDVQLSALELLRFGQKLEQQADRVREIHWGPRTLDVDIVTAANAKGAIYSSTSELMLPHPHAHQRAFVLVPWLDADPNATLDGASIAELIAGLDAAEVAGVQRSGHSWKQQAEGVSVQ